MKKLNTTFADGGHEAKVETAEGRVERFYCKLGCS
jgi:hypothetical protein